MKKKKREPIVNYDPSNDVLYLVTHKGVEAEFKEIIPGVKKSLESDYPRPQAGAFRPIHGYATAISV